MPLPHADLPPERIERQKNTLVRATNAELRERPIGPQRRGPYQVHTDEREGWVYFVQTVQGGPVRIGFAGKSVQWRLDEWKRYCPFQLRVLAVQSGGRRREYEIQRELHDYRLHGEWFSPDAPLLRTLIERVDARLGGADEAGK